MQHLGLQLGHQPGQLWLGMSSVCSDRPYSERFEQPKMALCGIGGGNSN